ncbi:MAG: SdpI family protein [Candidatus Peribacteraceae bacterium]|nr:SdpI family protein [Candidatus Peribacteraceae bacterium]
MDARPSRPLLWVKILIVAGMFLAGALLYPRLPDLITTHWGISGQPDGWMPKAYGTWLLPGLALLLMILFPILSRLDPKHENYALFARTWEIIQIAIVAMMAYIFAVQLYASIHPEAATLVGRFIFLGMGALFVVIGNYMGKIRQNFFVGLRTPWSLSDPEVWSLSQRFGGWMFVFGGLAFMIEAAIWTYEIPVFIAVLLLVTVVPIAYSYLLYRARKQ